MSPAEFCKKSLDKKYKLICYCFMSFPFAFTKSQIRKWKTFAKCKQDCPEFGFYFSLILNLKWLFLFASHETNKEYLSMRLFWHRSTYFVEKVIQKIVSCGKRRPSEAKGSLLCAWLLFIRECFSAWWTLREWGILGNSTSQISI